MIESGEFLESSLSQVDVFRSLLASSARIYDTDKDAFLGRVADYVGVRWDVLRGENNVTNVPRI